MLPASPVARAALPLLVLGLCACGPRELRFTMKADNNSGQVGFAVLTDRGATLDALVEVSRSDITDAQPLHIHSGTCGEIGPVVVGLTPLTPVPADPATFRSETRGVKLSFKDLTGGAYAVNAHDARDTGVYVSCGEVPRP